jgi:AP2 domain
MPRREPKRNIARLEPGKRSARRLAGWLVRIQRRGRSTSRFFSDHEAGGKRRALQAAKEFRDAVEEQAETWSVAERSDMLSTRNSSGVVGVHRLVQRQHRNGYEFSYAFWVAQWIDGQGHRKTRSFAVDKYGEDAALEAAVAARNSGVERAGR